MADIFISYSRHDSDFVERLRTELTAQKHSVWVDTSDILPTSHWRQEIIDAISAASAVLFVLSPDWLASEVSQRELALAVELQKKLIPVVYRDVDHRAINPALAEINWIFARPTDNAARTLEQIIFAIETDITYWRTGSDLLVRAQQWDAGKRNPAYTQRGEPLRRAENWLAEGATKRPGPSALQIEYINAGRRASAARQRTTIGSLTTGIIITLILAVLSSALYGTTVVQKNNLDKANHTLSTQNTQLRSAAISGQVNAQLLDGQTDRALLLAKYGYDQDKGASEVSRSTLFNALDYSPNLESVLSTSINMSVDDQAFAVNYSNDGKTAMTATRNGRITIWDMTKNLSRNTFDIPDSNATTNFQEAAYSPDGKYVATRHLKGGILLWDTTQGTQLTSFDATFYGGFTRVLTFSHDGQRLATSTCVDKACTAQQISIWNITTPSKPINIAFTSVKGYDPSNKTDSVHDLVFSPDDRLIAIGQCDTSCKHSRFDLLDVESQKPIASEAFSVVTGEAVQGQVKTLAFSPDGKTLALGGPFYENMGLSKIFFWDVTQRKFTQRTIVDAQSSGLEILAYSPDGKSIVTGSANSGIINLWDITTDQPSLYAYQFRGQTSAIDVITFSPDGKHFISTSLDARIILWRIRPFTSLSEPTGQSLAYSTDGKLIAVANGIDPVQKITIRTADTQQTKIVIPLPQGLLAFDLAFSPDGKVIAAGMTQNQVGLWDTSSGQPLGDPLIGIVNHDDVITHVTFSPDGKYLLSTTLHYQLTIWSIVSGQIVYFDIANLHDLRGINGAFSPDSRSFVLGNTSSDVTNNDVQFVDLGTGNVTTTLTGHKAKVLATAFSHDGALLASLDATGTIIFWDTKTHKQAGHMVKDRVGVSLVPNLIFSPDDQQLVSSHDFSLTIWNVKDRSLFVEPIASAHEFIVSARYSPDGTYLIIDINGNGVDVRDIKLDALAKSVCGIVNRNLTKDEWSQLFANIPNSPQVTLCPGVA